jgi:pyrrolidone-carboxylate peptidase
MKTTLVIAFGNFLENDFNSSKEFLNEIPLENRFIKKVLPVGYFKSEFIKPIKKYQPDKIIFLGMHKSRKIPNFEVVAKNHRITLKNSFYRFIITIYSYYLKWNNKNLQINKPISKEKLIVIPIQKNKPSKITLHSKPPTFKEIGISKESGNYVCNYSMWVVENYIKSHNLNIEFFFIHLPPKLTQAQKKELLKFIFE